MAKIKRKVQIFMVGILNGMSAFSLAEMPKYSPGRFHGFTGQSDLHNLRWDWEAIGQDIHHAYLEEASRY
jgi:hypothetical protein